MMQFLKIIFILCFFTNLFFAQDKSMLSANVGFGLYRSGGDLSQRFGSTSGMTASLEKSFTKGNSITLDYQLNFGSNVKEDVLAPYRNENGVVIGTNGLGAYAYLRMRSNYAGLLYGQPLNKKAKGLKLYLGGGLFSHYIRILDESRNLVIADTPYKKGYDRLSNGLAAKQELVYEYHGIDNNYHFNIGFSILEGFTNPVRKINFDSGTASSGGRMDLIYGIRMVWMVPMIKGKSSEVKYY